MSVLERPCSTDLVCDLAFSTIEHNYQCVEWCRIDFLNLFFYKETLHETWKFIFTYISLFLLTFFCLCQKWFLMIFKIFMTVTILIMFFSINLPCGLVTNPVFGGI